MLADTAVETDTLLELEAGAPDPDAELEVRPFCNDMEFFINKFRFCVAT